MIENTTDRTSKMNFAEVVRATVTRIIHDKILLGLVIVGILGLFVGGFATREESPASVKHAQAKDSDKSSSDSSEEQKSASVSPANGANPANLTPPLATDFVRWWVSGAMDYVAASAVPNHQAALRWMTPEAARTFETGLWTPDMAAGIAQGRIVAAFQPVSVQAVAINPDGSIVVTLTGTLVQQSGGRPFTQQLQMDLLVRRELDGLRIAGIYNRVASVPGNSVY